MWGNTNFFYIPGLRGDKRMQQFFVGGSYTAGPFTIGANAFWGTYAGAARFVFNTATGAFTPNPADPGGRGDRKSTRLNSSHANISYAVFCLKKKNVRTRGTNAR